MKALQIVKSILTALDLFPVQQFLRYKGSSDYRTATGGLCSLLVIALSVILFVNAGINVVNKASVNVTHVTQHQADPLLTTFSTSPEGKFMFAVHVLETGVSDGNYTYFNVSLQQGFIQTVNGNQSLIDIPLVPCTVDHFNFDQNLVAQFNSYNLGQWVCPPLGQQFTLSGGMFSDNYHYITILIKKCDTNVYTNCVPDSIMQQYIDSYGVLTAILGFVGTEINPSKSDNYLKYYLQTRNNVYFNPTLGAYSVAQIQDYEIDTDVSLLPLQQTVVERGIIIPNVFEHHAMSVIDGIYANIQFDKCPYITTYNRSFQKIDDFLSFVGGLVGLILSLIFIMGHYAELCFEISIGSRLFRLNEHEGIDSYSFSFGKYIKYLLFKVSGWLGFSVCYPIMEPYSRCQEVIKKQIDIQYLIERILFLERAINTIIGPNKFKIFHLTEKPTLKEAQSQHKILELYPKFRKKQKQGIDGKIIDQKSQNAERAFVSQECFSSMGSEQYKQVAQQLRKRTQLGGSDIKFLGQSIMMPVNDLFFQQNEQQREAKEGANLNRATTKQVTVGSKHRGKDLGQQVHEIDADQYYI